MAKGRMVGQNSAKRRTVRLAATVIIVGLVIFMLIPFIWMISSSFKKPADVMAQPFKLVPPYWYPDNYLRVLGLTGKTNYHFFRAYWNSVKVSVLGAAVTVVTSCMAGYAFAKLKFPGKHAVFLLFLSQMMIPTEMTLIPRFVIFSRIGLLNTHASLIIPHLVTVSSMFMMRQAFLGAPEELRESAKMDGAGEFRTFLQIMVPMVQPTVAAIATVQFMGAWNSYMDPLIFVNKEELFTLTLTLNEFVGQEATQYNLTMAACCMATVPVLAVFLCGQKFFMKGLTVGAVKG